MRKSVVWLLAGVVAAVATEGHAQATPPAGKPPVQKPAAPAKPPASAGAESKTVEGLTVTAESPQAFRSSIDRRSYGVASDLQSTTGSIGDALRNIPSVEVDVQGNVSLRGDPSVTIMIDGKPSGQFRGEGKAQALQNLPADQIERVEVVTNPSAAFKPDGAAGIINLITKKTRKPGGSGSVRANVGSSGRHNGGGSGSYNSNKITLSGDVGLRHDVQAQDSTDTRSRLNPATGAFVDSQRLSDRKDQVDFRNVRGSLDYDLDDKTRMSGELRRNQFKVDTLSTDSYGEPTPEAPVTAAYDRDGRLAFKRSNTEGSATYRRKFTGFEHELVLDLSQERTSEESRRRYVTANRIPASTLLEDIGARTIQDQTQFKADYTRPMPGESKLKTGYELEIDDNDYDNFGARGPAPGSVVPDPTLANHFLYKQTIHSLYGTYEKPFGDFTALAGLRLEDVQIDTDQVTLRLKGSHDYFRAYPTLHLAYRLSDAQQLTASYSHRVQRPQAQDLNPFRIYVDPFNFRQGNPNLEPQQTHSLEAGYQYRANGTFYLATVYYRQSYDVVTDVVRDLGGGVLLTTRANLGESRSGGLELVANGKLTKKLSYNVSANGYWNEIDASNLGFTGHRSAYSLGGRANLNWQVTGKDFLQVSGSMNGERLTPQGYRKPGGIVNLGYRHKFNDKLSAVVTAQDVLKTLGETLVIDTPTLHDRQVYKPDFRAVFVGLTYSFGSNGRKARDPGFEFGGGPPS